jgi:ACS family tartrate transporter-like MFS transporter
MVDFPTRMAAKIRFRLVVPTILFMLLSSIDRVNVSFAALSMNGDLGFTPADYGFGAGILFAGFLAGQYPSVLLLQRIGMRRWLGGCTLIWGAAAGGLALIDSYWQFCTLRVVLGLCEGGLAPGIVLYLSQFATERERATTFAMPMLAIPVSVIIGGPLSGWLLGMSAPMGIADWRWMFLAEAAPTLALGIVAFFYFPDRPDDARWLAGEEKAWLAANAANRAANRTRNDWRVLRRPIIWAAAVTWFCLLAGAYGIIFWLPQMLKQLTTLTPFEIGLANAVPWAANAVGIYLNATHSDRSGERFWHIIVPAVAAAIAILVAAHSGAGVAGLVALAAAGFFLGAAQGAFWALPTALFVPATFAVGAVAINIVGSSGGLVVPWAVGLAREATGGFDAPTLMLAGFLVAGATIVLAIRVRSGGRLAAHA